MSALFAKASSQILNSTTAVLTTFPVSVGMWVNPNQTSALCGLFAISDTTLANTITLVQSNAGLSSGAGWGVVAAPGNVIAQAGTATIGAWHYVLGIFAGTANRTIYVLNADGTMSTANNTTSAATAGVVATTFGDVSTAVNFPFDGYIAEAWIADSDITNGGTALDIATLTQLAYRGPFSMPSVVASIVEYHPFIQTLAAEQNDALENYYRGTPLVYTNVNGVKIAPHPPLAPGYVRPSDTRRVTPVG